MTRRPTRRAVPLCALLAVLLGGLFLRATSVAHAHTHAGSERGPQARSANVRPEAERSPSQDDTVQEGSLGHLGADGSLSDVAGLSAGDAWAVGQRNAWDMWRNRGVIMHWNGASWAEIPIRGDATGASHLRSVAASSPGEVWAVGDGRDGLPYVAKGSQDGFARIAVTELRTGDWLGGVAATGSRVVAVGSRDGRAFMAASGGAGKGTVWTSAAGPEGALYGVALAGKTDGWAVGDSGSAPIAMRLSENGWNQVDLPDIKGGFLRDVYAQSRKRAVAVGGVYTGDGRVDPLVLSWDGKRWTREDPPMRRVDLYGVGGDGDGTFWISGYDPGRPGQGFMLRYDGSHWTTMRGEDSADERTVRLQAVTRVADLTMAVGYVLDAKDHYTDLVERFGPPPVG
jgi:hypothetical protein